MLTFHRFAITAIASCSVLGAAGACSSDSAPLDNRDAESEDVSLDGGGRNDAVATDGAEVDVSVIDTVLADMTRVDVISTDTTSGDAPVDLPLSDRTSNDASLTDGASGDSALPDAPIDSMPVDAPIDSTPADVPTDSTPADAPAGDGANDPGCPPSWGPGGQCSGNLSCVYPEGVCECASACGPPPLPDAGNRWFCGMRGAGCPIQKPAVGTPCSMDAQFCNYGSCCQDLMKCEGGQWKFGGGLCPP
jgi:hypothetical protein